MNRFNVLFCLCLTFLSFAFAAEPLELSTLSGTLYGTLELPEDSAPYPVVLIHPGSGPTDQDGNQPQMNNDSLKLLAEALAAGGVASVRIDKRGVAESVAAGPDETELRFNTYIEDAAAWLELLQADERFGKVIMMGHSEGSLIGMVAAERVGADAFISLAGAGRPAGTVIAEQLSGQLPPDLLGASEEVLRRLEAGETVEPLPETLANVPGIDALFRPSVQPYLISWFRYDPAAELAKLSVPSLTVQGTTDLQTSAEDAALLSAARPDAQALTVEGMNHILKDAPADPQANFATYNDPNLPLAEGLTNALLDFIGALP